MCYWYWSLINYHWPWSGTLFNSGSDCDAYATICGTNGCCQTASLDNKGDNILCFFLRSSKMLSWWLFVSLILNCWLASPGVNDRQKGHTDEYTGESVLGTCFLFHLGKPSAIEVTIDEDLIFDAEIFLKIGTNKLFRCAKMGMMPGSLSLLRLNI